ncbi:PHP domain-containing protein, partial [Enterococcus faecalis]|nr:PHP domain-containing protein [Enterococcus faecalis]
MKKVDFHIHTLPNKFSDVNFEFSFEFLESYVNDMRLDAIAITNHNLFDIKQYEDIKSKLPCIVLPGVEVDIDNAHLLVLCPENKVDVFNEQCLKLNESINDNKKWIDFEEFEEIFSNYEEYLLIPHYKKKPKINQTTLKKFGNNIFAGEVNSPK